MRKATDKPLRCEEIAAILGVTIETVQRWCRDGVVPAVKIGRSWYVSQQALLRRFPDAFTGSVHA